MIIFLDSGSQPFKHLFDPLGAAGIVISFELASCFDYFLNKKCHRTVTMNSCGGRTPFGSINMIIRADYGLKMSFKIDLKIVSPR